MATALAGLDKGRGVLDNKFDLAYRPAVGDEHFYRMDACYRMLSERGTLIRRDSYIGDFRRVVTSVEDGVSTETVTWRNVVKREAYEDGPYENFEPISWAEGFEYSYSTLEYPAFLDDLYKKADDLYKKGEGFPRDFAGWNVLLLTLDAHVEFDWPRTSAGDIEKLRRPGDSCRSRESEGEEVPGIDFRPFIHTSPWQLEPLHSRFVGLTLSNGEPSAIIESELRNRAKFTMFMEDVEMESTSSLERRIVLRLSDGALESGTSVEWVCSSGFWINPVYTIEKIAEEEYSRPK